MKPHKLCLVHFIVLFGCLGFITGAPPKHIEVNCGNIAKVPSAHFSSIVFSADESSTGPCAPVTCYITPHSLTTLMTLNKNPRARIYYYPVYTWKDEQLGLVINSSVITLQPNSSVYPYDLPLILKTDDRDDGTFTIDCIAAVTEAAEPAATAGLSALYIAVIVIVILLVLILAALIVAFFTFRKVKKFLRRKRNLQSVQGSSWPEFLDNNNENNGGSGAILGGGTGYKSLDILNTDDHDLNRSRDLNQSDPMVTEPLTLHIDSAPASQTGHNDDPATQPLYINLSSPVHDLKSVPLSKNVPLSMNVPLSKSESTSNYSNGKSLHTVDRESTPLYIDAEKQCPVTAPSDKLLSNGDSDDEYSYTYVDTYIKSKPETKVKPVTDKPLPSVLLKPNIKDMPETHKSVPSVLPKPNIKEILKKKQSMDSLSSGDNVPVSNTVSSKIPVVQNPINCSVLGQVKLKPVNGTPKKPQSNGEVTKPYKPVNGTAQKPQSNGEVTKPYAGNITNKTTPKPATGNNIKPPPPPVTNKVSKPNPFAQKLQSNGQLPKPNDGNITNKTTPKPSTGKNIKPPPQAVQNNAGLTKPSNGTPKKALLPPKTPFHLKPLHSIPQQNNDPNRPYSELHYEDVEVP